MRPSKSKRLFKHQKGFTLIEVMLYIAISGLVLLVAFNSLGGEARSVQFTDSMRAIQDYLVGEQNKFREGAKPAIISNRGCRYQQNPPYSSEFLVGTVSDGTCIVFGKIFVFDSTPLNNQKIVSYDLLGRAVDSADYGAGEDGCNPKNLHCVRPFVVVDSYTEYEIPWGTEFIRGNTVNSIWDTPGSDYGGDGVIDNTRAFGFLKEPISNRIIPIVYKKGIELNTIDLLNDPNNYREFSEECSVSNGAMTPSGAIDGQPPCTDRISAMNAEFNTAFCFQGRNGQIAMIQIGVDEEQEAISLNFSEKIENVPSPWFPGLELEGHDCTA